MYKNLNGLHHQHRANIRSNSCVSLGWLNGVTQYWSRNLCGFAYRIWWCVLSSVRLVSIFVEYYVS
ncbi:hypothetical protein T12_5438, partial [Trichinella patagoniensis]